MSILGKIIANTAQEVAERKKSVSNKQLEQQSMFGRTCYSFRDYLLAPEKSGIIAEIKKQSPSKGIINDKISVPDVAEAYRNANASAISVLTDFVFFGGKMEYLTEARQRVDIPILRKDFIIDEYQLLEAKAIGADVVLLIAACLSPQELNHLAQFAHNLGLEVLMEVHNREELDRSLNPHLDVVGVNNRNLGTFETSIQTSIDLAPHIPDSFLKISESALKDAETIIELKSVGYQGFLIGETFMKTDNPGNALAELVNAITLAEKQHEA